MVASKPLVVYKASAGSGKTFTLAVEYIKLLVQDPNAFRKTLAVTFTNKATEEMKMRILSQLYGISHGLEASDSYLKKVCEDLDMQPEHVRHQAGIALHQLLHNFSYFRVETIDSFFQSVLRNLARELDLAANLHVGLNDDQVEELAVDQLIDSLQTTDQMLQWLMNYIMETISDDRSWNVIGQIKKFGKTIFKDFYKQHSKRLCEVISQPGFLDNYAAMLRDIRKTSAEHMKQIAESFFDVLDRESLTVDDFSNKRRGVCAIFIKIKNGQFDESIINKTVADAMGNPAKWVTKTHPDAAAIQALVESELDALLRYAVEEQPRQWKLYKSADLTLRHISQLRLLDSIEQKVRTLNGDANRFLLSDTQQLLHDLIDGSDSPFIFEKIGTQLEHIMIDEFQDTSTVQWKNFRILLQEAMSHQDSSNLIVGDVKQSIYRWRSGDWRLLADIKAAFSDDGTTVPHVAQMIEERPLENNYRSERNIIEFNNSFFAEAAKIEEVEAYGDVKQKYPSDKPERGYVEVRLLPSEDYREKTMEAIVEQIELLREKHIDVNKMAILVRNNKYIPLIANHLMEVLPDINVVSEEAFRLDASQAVVTIIQAMRLLLQPDDAIARAFLAKSHSGALDGTLPEAFEEHTQELLKQPLYELAERLYGIFHLDQVAGQTAYLCAFYDQVANYVNENSTDLSAFLDTWDESISGKTIQSPEINGIRILSIHKSKGLEFDHVIIPFCDWKMEHSDILWCEPGEAPFNELPFAPIDYSKKSMTGTIYEKDYQEEHLQNTVDNLNLLYVAFTRASKSLFVVTRRKGKTDRSVLIESTLPNIVKDKLQTAAISGMEDTATDMIFTFGQIEDETEDDRTKKTKEEHNPFLKKPQPLDIHLNVHEQKVVFRQSNKSVEFATPPDDDDAPAATNYIQLGSVLHQVFSTIRSTQDIDQALKGLETEGIIYDREISREHLQNMIRRRLQTPQVAEWFEPGRWTLYNECSILTTDGGTRRPDRVMTDGSQTIVVDFKFGSERTDYHDQVREYMNLLTEMGMPQVRGYLWFVYSNKIVEVK